MSRVRCHASFTMTGSTSGGRPRSPRRVARNTTATSIASSPRVRALMQAQRTRDTAPELALRRLLHARGMRYRVDRVVLAGTRARADIVFVAPRVAVFVDGCYWHGCPTHGRLPASNSEWWRQKIERNRSRDQRANASLQAAGWEVVRVWEHEDPAEAADRIQAAVAARLGGRNA